MSTKRDTRIKMLKDQLNELQDTLATEKGELAELKDDVDYYADAVRSECEDLIDDVLNNHGGDYGFDNFESTAEDYANVVEDVDEKTREVDDTSTKINEIKKALKRFKK